MLRLYLEETRLFVKAVNKLITHVNTVTVENIYSERRTVLLVLFEYVIVKTISRQLPYVVLKGLPHP